MSLLQKVIRLKQEIYLFYCVYKKQCGRNDRNSGGKMVLYRDTAVHTALDFQNFLPKANLEWFHSNLTILVSLQQPSLAPETES
jgi:hypothetical protein